MQRQGEHEGEEAEDLQERPEGGKCVLYQEWNCRMPRSTLPAHSLTSETGKCHCSDSGEELEARAGYGVWGRIWVTETEI